MAWDIRQWQTLPDFTSWLRAQPIPRWPAGVPSGITLHHTWRPRLDQWRGPVSMQGLKSYYQSKDWDRGPHLFLAAGSPNPAHDGIWQLSPLSDWSIHAGGDGQSGCNASRVSIEIVGDYDAVPWSDATKALVRDVVIALFLHYDLTAYSLNGHWECGSRKSCPGRAIDMDQVRAWLAIEHLHVLQETHAMTWDDQLTIIAAPRCTLEQAAASMLKRPHGTYTPYDIARVIVPEYWTVCSSVGVDPCVAVAQMIHETGNLTSVRSQRPQRNPAGIGATDDQVQGAFFESWTGPSGAVAAQVGRLVAWAVSPSDRTPVQQQLVAHALAVKALPLPCHGSAPILRLLGKAHNPSGYGWADPGTDYGQRIAETMIALRGGAL